MSHKEHCGNEVSKRHEYDIKLASTLSKRIASSLEEDFQKLDNNGVGGALARAKAFALAGYKEEAQQSLRDALAFDPECDEAAARLALLNVQTGDAEEALEVATHLVSRSPNFSTVEITSDQKINAFTILGRALVANNRNEDAVKSFERAREVEPEDTFAAAHLAQLYLSLGNPEQAVAQLDSISQNPRFRDLASTLQLGLTHEALLPKFSSAQTSAIIVSVGAGRPMIVNGAVRLADVVENEASWC